MSCAENRIASLYHRHSLFSPTCPNCLFVKSDNEPLSVQERNLYLYRSNPQVLTSFQNQAPVFCCSPGPSLPFRPSSDDATGISLAVHVDGEPGVGAITTCESVAALARYTANGEALFSQKPDLDESDYFELRAQYPDEDCWFTSCSWGGEAFAEMHSPDHVFGSYFNLEGDILQRTLIDDLISSPAQRPEFLRSVAREDTFTQAKWSERIAHPSVESLVEAGFYVAPTGAGPGDEARGGPNVVVADDAVSCFYCGLGLNSWEPNDEPWREHARFSPRCGWVLRCKGRQWVRKLIQEMSILQTQTQPQAQAQGFENSTASQDLLKSWDQVPGLLADLFVLAKNHGMKALELNGTGNI